MKIKDIQRESLAPILDGWVLMEGPDGTTYKIKVGNFTPEGKFKNFITSYQVGNMKVNTVLTDKTALDAIAIMASRDFKQATGSIDSFATLEKGISNAITVKGSITLNDVQSSQLSIRILKKNGQTWANFSSLTYSYSDSIEQSTTYWLGFDVNMPDGSIVEVEASRQAVCVAPTFQGVSADEYVLEGEARTGTKNLWGTAASRAITYNSNNAHPYFFEPKSHGLRARIMDQNGFNVTAAFEVVTRLFTLKANTAPEGQVSNAITEEYYGYIKKTPAGNGSAFTYTFHNS